MPLLFHIPSAAVLHSIPLTNCKASCDNDANWKTNMHMVLLSLQQWGMLVGTIVRPVPVDKDHVTLTNTQISDKEYIDIASVSRPTSSSTSLVGSTMQKVAARYPF